MRKLILAPMALACLIGSALAQQSPTSTVDQGKAGAAAWPVSWTGQSVLADLRIAGNPVTALNPVPIAGSITANIGTTNGLGLDTSLQQIRTTLGSPFQAGGSIGNTAFGISGTLPAFAATPTFNIGTLNGAATAALQSSANTFLSAISGQLPASLGQKPSAASLSVVLATDQTVSVSQGRVLIFAPLATVAPFSASSSTATPERVTGAVAGGAAGGYSTYRVFARSDQTFTLNIIGRATSGGANVILATTSVAANTPTWISAPALYPIVIGQAINNGSAATAFSLTDGFTAD